MARTIKIKFLFVEERNWSKKDPLYSTDIPISENLVRVEQGIIFRLIQDLGLGLTIWPVRHTNPSQITDVYAVFEGKLPNQKLLVIDYDSMDSDLEMIFKKIPPSPT